MDISEALRRCDGNFMLFGGCECWDDEEEYQEEEDTEEKKKQVEDK